MRVNLYDLKLNEDNVPKLVKLKGYNYNCTELSSPDQISKLMRDLFGIHELVEEHAYLLCMSVDLSLIGIFEVSHGTLSTTFMGIREIMMRALMCNSSSFVVVHNHPSQNCEISSEDIESYKWLCDAGNMMQINCLDSIIISKDGFVSCYSSIGSENEEGSELNE